MAVTGIEIWSAYLAGDASLVLKTRGAREGQGIDTATTPPILRRLSAIDPGSGPPKSGGRGITTPEQRCSSSEFNRETEMTEAKKCGCGRSPTGLCMGWHSLTNEEYQAKLKERDLKESKQLLKE